MPLELATISMKDLVAAREFAILKHGDQKYASALPYEKHLADVVNVLVRFGVGGDIRTAGWLHDILEDTDCTVPELYSRFSSSVCGLVVAVTNEAGKNRKERHLATWPKIREYGQNAVILKLADRIANTEFSLSDGGGSLLGMYRKEFPAFYDALYRPNECDVMWEHLKTLSARPEAA